MQPDKPRPKITIKRKPRKVEAAAATEPTVQVASSKGEHIQPGIEAVELATPTPAEPGQEEGQSPTPELTAKQLKKQRRRERKAAEAALLTEAEAETARVAEMQAEAERAAAAEAEAARTAKRRAEKASWLAALTPEEREERDARLEAEKTAGFERRMEALRILNTNPIFYYFKPLAIGSDKELSDWAFKEGKGKVSAKAISDVIGAHCNHPHYLKKLAKGGKRYRPMSGLADGEVTPEQRTHAFEKLLKRDMERKKARLERLAERLPMDMGMDVTEESATERQEPLSSEGGSLA